MARTPQFNIRLPEELKERMTLFEKATGMNKSEQIRRALDKWLKEVGV